jgi:hypothetical protein
MILYIKDIFIKIKYIVYVYFTYLPYSIYNNANKIGNLAISGIGFGLINCQKVFWISNIGTFIIFYNKTDKNLYYLNIILFFIFSFSYIISLLKTIYLIKFIIPMENKIK